MNHYLALFRGLNVGKGNRIRMAELCACLEGIGLRHVQTLLASGNAVFSSPDSSTALLAERIQQALLTACGIKALVVVQSRTELAAIIAAQPFALPAEAAPRLLVAFVQQPAQLPPLSVLAPLLIAGEQWALGPAAGYLYCAQGINQSAAAEALLTKLGKQATTRNWATVQKLAALLESRP